MDKRTFLKTSSVILAGSSLSPFLSCNSSSTPTESLSPVEPLRNWAGNLTYSTNNVHFPTSVAEVQEAVKAGAKMKGLGSQHSFNTVADSQYMQVSLREMKKIIAIDPDKKEVTIEGGVRYGDFVEALHQQGMALHNLASLPHISVAGACSTATHGSGVTNPTLAAGVKAIELVKANGDIIQLSREKDGDLFNGAVVALGGLGIVTKVTLDVQPSYDMQQVVYRNMPMAALERNFEEIMSSGYSVSLFTDWRNQNINEVWIKSKVGAENIVSGPEYFGGTLADRDLHPVEDQSAESCTEQMGVVGPWFARLPHFKMGFTPSSGDELQAEYFVPMEKGYEAIMAVEQLNAQISPNLYITEVRTIAADNLWMSPYYQQPSVSIHFTFKPNWEAVQKLLPQIEEALAPYNVRPHWGKLFRMAPAILQSRIKKLDIFKTLLKDFDPEGKFKNAFIDRNLF